MASASPADHSPWWPTNVGALAARSYRVGVRDPDDRVVAIHGDSGHLHLSFHSRPGASATPPPWVGRLSDLLAQIAPPPTPTLK